MSVMLGGTLSLIHRRRAPCNRTVLIVPHDFGVCSEGLRIPAARRSPHRNRSAPGGELASLGLGHAPSSSWRQHDYLSRNGHLPDRGRFCCRDWHANRDGVRTRYLGFVTGGKATAATPSAAGNCRRPMVTVIRPSRARCVRERYHATSVLS